MNITRFTSVISLASLTFVTGCVTSKPDSEQLDFLTRRTGVLEQQVHDLEVSNAELQKQVRALQERERLQIPGMPPLNPPQSPRVPPRSQPPHLTPLDTK
jgi:hypothetical protein